jgi:hypothetical protein
MDEDRVRYLARYASDVGSPLVFDLEHWPVDVRTFSDGEVQQRIEFLTQMVDWAHQERPGLKVGFYGLMPLTDYWTPVGGNPEFVANWSAANRRLQPLADRVDILFPSLYAFYEDRYSWQYYAQANLREAAAYGKPVAPFLGMVYHESEPDVRGRKIPADYWKLQLQTVAGFTNQVVYWGGFLQPWNDDDGWWAVTREYRAPKRLAADIANVTPDPRSTPVDQMTLRFTRPVLGLDLADVSLTRDGGPNLLASAPGITLTTADSVTWSLGGLTGLTAVDGDYKLTLVASNSGIRDAGGEQLAVGASEAFTVNRSTPVTATGSFD